MKNKTKQDSIIEHMLADERELMLKDSLTDIQSAEDAIRSIRLSVKHALEQIEHLMALKVLGTFYDDLEFVRSEIASVNSDAYAVEARLQAVSDAIEA